VRNHQKGVSLFSATHPKGPWYKNIWKRFFVGINKCSLETMEIEIEEPSRNND
jgi:hypothetical protein